MRLLLVKISRTGIFGVEIELRPANAHLSQCLSYGYVTDADEQKTEPMGISRCLQTFMIW